MQAIETHYLGPTNTKGSRIVASTANGDRVIIPCFTSASDSKNHARAANALKNKLKWEQYGTMLGASTKRGMVWIFEDDTLRINP